MCVCGGGGGINSFVYNQTDLENGVGGGGGVLTVSV